MKNSFLLLMFITALNVGSFDLPSPLIYGADLLNGVLVFMSFRAWKKMRQPFNIIFITWIILGVYIGILAINSDYVTGLSTLLYSLRELYPFGLLLYIYCLVDEDQLQFYIYYLHFLCVAGGLLAIAQSLHGTDGLFADDGFYHRGHSGGQNYMINGFLARVALPTIYLIQVMFLYTIYEMIYKKAKLYHFALLPLYMAVILIGFSRSSWAGLVICIALALLITFVIRKERFQKAISFILVSILCIAMLLSFIDTPFVETIQQTISERIDELFYDLERKDGNLGSRLSTIELGMRLYQSSPWTGIDINLITLYEMYQMTDVGYLYALLTIGLIGLIMLCLWYLVTIIISYNYILKSSRRKDTDGILFSMLLFTNIIFFIIIQQANQFTFSTACLAISTGLFLVKFRSDS